MKYVSMKVGMRVVVTHHASKHKGNVGTITETGLLVGVDSYALVKLNNGVERSFHCGSINPYLFKETESLSEPLTADDIVVGTELIYNGSMRGSRRRIGDVYVVTRVFFNNGIKYIKYKYKSGHKPLGFQEIGVLLARDVLKFWEIAL